ncbi:MAG: hypothetical protein CMC53_01865, partial [Flavobacteriaceae bacterium]|nr:hypothetical protein [Flavobacteriaceae bacterium]
NSTDKFYHLYIFILSFFVEFQNYCEESLEISKKKYLEDKSFKFYSIISKHLFLKKISSDTFLKSQIDLFNINYWNEFPDHLEKIVKEIEHKNLFNHDDLKTNGDFELQRKQVVAVFKKLVATDSKLYDYIEDSQLSWANDFALVNSLILSDLNRIKKKSSKSFVHKSLYKNREDSDFGLKLVECNFSNEKLIENEIIKVIDNWDIDRVAKIDMVLLKMCVSEFIYFESIPIKVSINEYLDMSKDYSSSKSNVFLNGILDKLSKTLQGRGLINKNKKGSK